MLNNELQKVYDQQFASKMQQHQLKLKNEIDQMLAQKRQRQQEELKKMKAMLSAMTVLR